MSDEIFRPDANFKAGGLVGGVSSAEDGQKLVLRLNPTTKRALVDVSQPDAIIGAADPTVDSYADDPISTSANTANQQLVATPGASKQIWVYGIQYVVGTAAGTVSFQDSDDTAITGVMSHALNSGQSIPPSGNFSMPIWKVATNKALEVDTVTCDIEGSIQYAIISV